MAREFCMFKSNNMCKIMLPNYTKNSAKMNKKHKILFGAVLIMALTTPPTVVVDTIGVGSFCFIILQVKKQDSTLSRLANGISG